MSNNTIATCGWLAFLTGCALWLRAQSRQKNDTQHASNSKSKNSNIKNNNVGNNALFQSSSFSDAEILNQLLDERYQTPLSAHNSACVSRLGPCFMALAKSVQSGATLEVSLAKQSLMSPELRAFLAADLPGLARAMRVIAESYLLRSKGGSNSSSSGAAVVSTGETLHKSVLGKDSVDTGADVVTSVSNPPQEKQKKKKKKGTVSIECDSGVKYHPMKFLAKGSAGEVYAARRVGSKMMRVVGKAMTVNKSKRKFLGAVRKQLDQQLVLKKVMPTQRSSALNEYRIGCVLLDLDNNSNDDSDDEKHSENSESGGGKDYCITYLDKAEQDGHLWLLLRRVTPSTFGVDLSEYIAAGFFENEAHQSHARAIVLQLTQGLEHIGNLNVIMRDVKSDNVLIESETLMDGNVAYSAKWSDYGLAVHLGDRLCDGQGLRSPDALQQGRASGSVGRSSGDDVDPAEEHFEALVGFWYDSQKLVPKPKWKGRRPPELCFQDPETVHASSYDVYMLGIIFLCMVSGVDIPHINKLAERQNYEAVVRLGTKPLGEDYLDTLEMGDELRAHGPAFRALASRTFGAEFGNKLMILSEKMLARDPRARPNPTECIAAMTL